MCSSQVWNNTADETAIFESHRKFETRVYINIHSSISQQFFSVNNQQTTMHTQYKPRRFFLIRYFNFTFIIQVHILIYLRNMLMYFGPAGECCGIPQTLPRNSSFFAAEKRGPWLW